MSAVASQEEAQRFVEKPAPAEANSTGQDYCFEKAVDQLVLANLLRVNEFRSGPADDDAPDARGNRFPADFMFQLSKREFDSLKSQIVTSSWGGARRARPYAFTEQGVAMLSSVLRIERAVQVNIEIMRAFVRLRRMLDSNAKLSRRLDELEAKYDDQFRVVFDAIRELMEPTDDQADRPRIGYESEARRSKPR